MRLGEHMLKNTIHFIIILNHLMTLLLIEKNKISYLFLDKAHTQELINALDD